MPRVMVRKDELKAKLKETGRKSPGKAMKFSSRSGKPAAPAKYRCWVLDEVDWYIFTGMHSKWGGIYCER
jgi:hypothetical protein